MDIDDVSGKNPGALSNTSDTQVPESIADTISQLQTILNKKIKDWGMSLQEEMKMSGG